MSRKSELKAVQTHAKILINSRREKILHLPEIER